MKQRLLILCLTLFCGAYSLQAQTKVQLSVPDVLASTDQGVICAPVIADSFPDIAALQFSLKWDTLKLDFVEARFGANPLMLGSLDTTTLSTSDQFGVTYTTPDLSGTTLTSGTVILEICFNAIGDEGESPITWDGFYPGEFAQGGSIEPYPFEFIAGSISFGSNAVVNVLPGDTNDDGQVDHRDLLNIGLLEGTTGPARPNVSVAFVQQNTTPWPTSLLNGLNHAKVDANGNGLIGTTDADLVNDYYGRAEGAFVLAPDVSTPSGPELLLEIADTIELGNTITARVLLGDGTDPDAVGYGLAFALEFDPTKIDASTLSTNLGNAFLGSDLYTLSKLTTRAEGRLEVVLSRKDQTNTSTPGGEICQISFEPLNPDNVASYETDIKLIPNAFLRANQANGDIRGGTKTVTVKRPVSAREPSWARELRVYPNPYTNGPLLIQGDLPAFDEVALLTVTGQRVLTNSGNVRQLDLTALPAGTYLLQVSIAGERVTRRVVRR